MSAMAVGTMASVCTILVLEPINTGAIRAIENDYYSWVLQYYDVGKFSLVTQVVHHISSDFDET